MNVANRNVTKRNSTHQMSPAKLVVIAIILILGIAGIALIGNGIWVKAKAELAQVLLERAFDRVKSGSQSNSTDAKPWYWADINPIARLNVPHLGKQEIILNNVSGEALAFGPGHLHNTPLPGEPGTSVVAAHRDTHFAWLGQLDKGDSVKVERSDGSIHTFRITRSWIAPFDQSGINASSDGHRLVLSTCYPFNSTQPGPLRYMVEANLVHPERIDGKKSF